MSDFLKRSTEWAILIAVIICTTIYLGMTYLNKLDRERVEYMIGVDHIKIVTLTDRNCNDCHLGVSFVNLFNHPSVKSNDNVIIMMMDRAKIKRW